ncbi:MAG: SurA N-terminal domain-containing protein [Clostridium sp.]|nr:SurA N-terminal domain-containing protein [Clostridium sp.]MCM1171608.1 SurA N-terminal domain-containing protein [Clostridium sp.]MCM1207577.1 SurA N-terminal domain-containing protein [Ruminococcus sp.]
MQKIREKRIYKYIAAVMIMLLCVLLAGCGETAETEQKDDTVVFTFGGTDVSVGETYIYYTTVKEKYELLYGEEVWQTKAASGSDAEASAAELIREDVINEIVRVKTLVRQAETYNIKLTDIEEEEIAAEAEVFFKGLTDADTRRMSIDLGTVTLVMKENRLAKEVEAALLAEDPVEVSDEQARMTRFYDMYFNCFIEDANGNIIPFSEEQRHTQYERAVEACGELSTVSVDNDNKREPSIEDIAALYSLDKAKEYTMSPEEIKDVYGEEVHDVLYAMSNGEHSTVIETEYGYHVFKMIALTDKKATQAKKAVMTEDAIDECLKSKLTEWRNEIDESFSYPDSVNMDAYGKIN